MGRISPRNGFRTVVVAVCLLAALGAGAAAAVAGTHTYHDGDSWAGAWSYSGVDDIRGGLAESLCGVYCSVTIQTTTSFYPYYPLASASGAVYVELNHGTQDDSRSRCKHDWDGSYGSAGLECSYKY